jgi:dTDP-4-dehydrorhamnose 3,5-epimerase
MGVNFVATEIPEVLVVQPDVLRDERGFFTESYNARAWAEHGIVVTFVQDNHSRSAANVVRGLHYQDGRAPMGKLVRCTRGAILDVAVDLRAGSPTFGRHVARELNEENMLQLWVPEGFGHGFASLVEGSEVQYKCTNYYAPETEGAVRWDDPELAISWPFGDPTISAKDERAMSFADYRAAPAFSFVAG